MAYFQPLPTPCDDSPMQINCEKPSLEATKMVAKLWYILCRVQCLSQEIECEAG